MLTDAQRQAAADVLLQAERTRVPCVQPSRQWPGMDLEDAYDVQRRWAEARIAQGARIVGRKIGQRCGDVPLSTLNQQPLRLQTHFHRRITERCKCTIDEAFAALDAKLSTCLNNA